MAELLLISIGILALGIASSLVLMMRSGETRVGLLTLCFALVATRQGIALWSSWNAPLALDATAAAEISLLVACGIGLAILAALWRTLAERDRAESLHWNSMEAVRLLGEIAATPMLSLDEKLDALLKIGCERFDLEIGVVSRVDKQRYEVIAMRATEKFPVSRGAVLLLADTDCAQALVSKRPVARERIDEGSQPGHPNRSSFGFRAYLGTAIHVYDEVIGTLCFGSRHPRRRRFTATDKDLLALMSLWVGTEIERRIATEEREAIAGRAAEPAPVLPGRAHRREASAPRVVDVNAAIRRAEKNLRALVEPGVEIDLLLADDLHPTIRLPVGLGAILESLVFEAAEPLCGSGRLTIATANLEIANGSADGVPAVAPNHYVTLSVTASGQAIEAESFARAFDAPQGGAEAGNGRATGEHLPVATIYRLLQRCGGDLSLEVESGKGSTFTVFLPRAPAEAAAPRPSSARAEPGGPA